MPYAFHSTYRTPTASQGTLSDQLSQLILSVLPEYAELRAGLYAAPKQSATDSTEPLTHAFDLPGFTKDQITLEVAHDGILTVTAQNEKRGKVVRTLWLDEGIDIEQISAKLDSGVLVLTFTRLPEAKPRKIPVA